VNVRRENNNWCISQEGVSVQDTKGTLARSDGGTNQSLQIGDFRTLHSRRGNSHAVRNRGRVDSSHVASDHDVKTAKQQRTLHYTVLFFGRREGG
jgi:hypothetical protein